MWIKVTDELPKNDEWVFIATKETETCIAGSFYGMRRGNIWYDASGNAAPTDGITHWMTLPDPPTAGDNNAPYSNQRA
jgi:hypothetical protein